MTRLDPSHGIPRACPEAPSSSRPSLPYTGKPCASSKRRYAKGPMPGPAPATVSEATPAGRTTLHAGRYPSSTCQRASWRRQVGQAGIRTTDAAATGRPHARRFYGDGQAISQDCGLWLRTGDQSAVRMLWLRAGHRTTDAAVTDRGQMASLANVAAAGKPSA